VFGYITVLPGAFSAYRYIALQNDVAGQGPLQKYFLGETMVRIQASVHPLTDFPQHGAGADIFTANMYLAEDRVCRHLLQSSALISHEPARFCAGSSYQNGELLGRYTTSSPHMV